MKPILILTALLLAPLAAPLAADLSDAEKPRVTPSALAATETAPSSSKGLLVLSSSSSYLTEGFAWAKRTALSKVHPDNGGCYQAALQDRGGYCQRDYVHQIDGAALLGLHRENLAMLRCFATNQTKARGWFTLWEINYDGTPMACDYRDDGNFWRNTAGMFDLLHGAYRMHRWTGDPALVQDPLLQGFYSRTVNEFVAEHDRNGNGIAEGRILARLGHLLHLQRDPWEGSRRGRRQPGHPAPGLRGLCAFPAGEGRRFRRAGLGRQGRAGCSASSTTPGMMPPPAAFPFVGYHPPQPPTELAVPKRWARARKKTPTQMVSQRRCSATWKRAPIAARGENGVELARYTHPTPVRARIRRRTHYRRPHRPCSVTVGESSPNTKTSTWKRTPKRDRLITVR